MAPLEVVNDKKNHLGYFFLDLMRQKPPEEIFQIDAATDEKETNREVLERSIRLALCLRALGLQAGDVLALGGRNHIDLHIPYYAALLNGYPIAGVDPYFKEKEIKHFFNVTKPKIAFCQKETRKLYEKASQDLGIDVKIVTFDGDDEDFTFSKLMESYDGENEDLEAFTPAQIDSDKIYAWLVTTSGTTGLPKVAAFKHKLIIEQMDLYMNMTKPKEGQRKAFNGAPVQWISGYFNALSMPALNLTKLQTSTPDDIGHIIDVINKHKPVTMMSSPSTLSLILQHEKTCNWKCFDTLAATGAKVYKELKIQIKNKLRPDTIFMEAYGQTETIGLILKPNPEGPIASCGVPMPAFMRQVKLVDPENNDEITEPYVTGELWTKGPSFTEYYNNPEETAKAFTDGWYKTGDLLYRDESNNYYFVDRLKMLIKYRNYHINPTELEETIMHVPGVQEVCVVGVPHPVDSERAVAAAVRRPGCDVTADTVHDIVNNNLAPTKHLRGGVIFLDSLPKTSSGKVARAQVKSLVLSLNV